MEQLAVLFQDMNAKSHHLPQSCQTIPRMLRPITVQSHAGETQQVLLQDIFSAHIFKEPS